MRSSRWNAQGNVYLVTDDGPLTPERARAAVGDADGILLIPRVRESEVFDTAREIEEAEQAIERETAKGIRLDEARRAFRYHQLQTHA